jgi:fructokinase
MKRIVCFGEILWDIYPNGNKILGGAPLNVAIQLINHGLKSSIISALGKDELGSISLGKLKELGISTSTISIIDDFKTSEVKLFLNSDKCASYNIEYPVAWDKIPITNSAIESVSNSDVFVFGSLASRDDVSRSTLIELISYSTYNVFDLNLRAPFYELSIICSLLKKTNLLKVNNEELEILIKLLGLSPKDSPQKNIKIISNIYSDLDICLTMGSDGSILFYDNKFYAQKSFNVNVVDTVGAGDSFLAVLIGGLISGDSPQTALQKASAIGAYVAASYGANPKINWETIDQIINS